MAKNWINIDLPPGLRSNGTEYVNRGNWVDGSRIRWSRGAIRPIGGWSLFTVSTGQLNRLILDPSQELARAIATWRANDGTSLYAVGTNKRVLAWGRALSTVYDITPLDFTERPAQNAAPDGYGNWFYGFESYGTRRPTEEVKQNTFSWCFRNWGQNLLAAPRNAPSKLYQWDTAFGNRMTAVPNAPIDFDCFHVTDQRIVMCAGSPTDPRLVQWSDREDLTDWTPAVDNMAGFQSLPGIGRFLDIVTVQDQCLLVSETDVYIGRYVSAPYVMGFEQLGERCGAVSAMSIVTTEDFAMWPGINSFFFCDGASVIRIECDVMDKIMDAIAMPQITKMTGFVNPHFPEIWWLYQAGEDDIDSYVYYDWVQKIWGHGKLDRVTGGGYATTGGLIMVDREGFVYNHEIQDALPLDPDEPDNAIFVRSGPIELTTGNTTQYVKAIQPDFAPQGVVSVSLIGKDAPQAPARTYGPFNIPFPSVKNQPIPARARGHSMAVLVEGLSGAWSLGSMRLDFAQGGEK